MGGGRGRTSGSCRYRTPKVHAECSREAPGRESRTTMMRRQMGDIGAIANVCNTDLQEPTDDSASAGRDEDFPRTNPQIPRHFGIRGTTAIRQPADTDTSPNPRKATRQEPGTTDTTAGSDSQKCAAITRRDPNSGFPPRTSRSNPELRVHLPVAVLSRRPRPSTSRTGSSAPRPHLPHRQHQPGACASTPHSPGTVCAHVFVQ